MFRARPAAGLVDRGFDGYDIRERLIEQMCSPASVRHVTASDTRWQPEALSNGQLVERSFDKLVHDCIMAPRGAATAETIWHA